MGPNILATMRKPFCLFRYFLKSYHAKTDSKAQCLEFSLERGGTCSFHFPSCRHLSSSTGSKNRSTFLSPARHTQKIAATFDDEILRFNHRACARPGGFPSARRDLASGQYPPHLRLRSTQCFCPFSSPFTKLSYRIHLSFTILHRTL